MLLHDGRRGSDRCHLCLKVNTALEAAYRCLDCFSSYSRCRACILLEHVYTPLHRVEVSIFWFFNFHIWWGQRWDGFWRRTSLLHLGIVIQLGHTGRDECTTPLLDVWPLTIVHTNGIHILPVRYCGCSGLEKRYQLLRTRWFPATQSQPATVFTFDVLDFFLEISYQGKTNAHDFCTSLENLTDGCGFQVPVRRNIICL